MLSLNHVHVYFDPTESFITSHKSTKLIFLFMFNYIDLFLPKLISKGLWLCFLVPQPFPKIFGYFFSCHNKKNLYLFQVWASKLVQLFHSSCLPSCLTTILFPLNFVDMDTSNFPFTLILWNCVFHPSFHKILLFNNVNVRTISLE